jgi:hypothetical protein
MNVGCPVKTPHTDWRVLLSGIRHTRDYLPRQVFINVVRASPVSFCVVAFWLQVFSFSCSGDRRADVPGVFFMQLLMKVRYWSLAKFC